MKSYIDYFEPGGKSLKRYWSNSPTGKETKNVPDGSIVKGLINSLKEFIDLYKNRKNEKIDVKTLKNTPDPNWTNDHTKLERHSDGYYLTYYNNPSLDYTSISTDE